MLSIIVPVFNDFKRLYSTLDSILKNMSGNFEIIIVDDGSKELLTRDKLLNYSSLDNIKIITKVNGGVGSARNMGLNYANGDYITFIDSDDILCGDLNSIIRMYSEKLEFDILKYKFTNRIDLNKNDFIGDFYQYQGKDLFLKELLNSFVWNSVCTTIYKAHNLKGCYFKEHLSMGEDLLFQYEVLKNVNNAIYVNHQMYEYTNNQQSTTRTYSMDTIIKNLESLFYLNDYFRNELSSNKINSNQNKQINSNMMKDCVIFMRRVYDQYGYKEYKKIQGRYKNQVTKITKDSNLLSRVKFEISRILIKINNIKGMRGK
ncbi:glycosyltransferase family 2 protein [Acholeplasma laidlawii]|uniref:glycosyltransferase family 2 protein n=1 Tax=Acholeplasma laidlawii TaxID=2148 RepID=UPI00254014BB|nr:glycosyltransferase [Acholeplasma laidlawii]